MAKQPTPKKPVRSAAREAMNESGGKIISTKPVSKKSEPIKGPSIKKEEKPFKFNPEPSRTSGNKAKAINLPTKDAPKPSAVSMSKKSAPIKKKK